MTKTISHELFNTLLTAGSVIAMAWKLTRKDGEIFGFTSHDKQVAIDGLVYSPLNAFSGTATVARSTLSVDNMSAVVLTSDIFVKKDLKGGRWDNALCEVFWYSPDNPGFGIIPLRGGRIGEITLTQGKWETELRSIIQQLQQPYGKLYTLECGHDLGDSICRVKMAADVWTANTKYYKKLSTEAGVGSIVKPSVYNGFWYACTASVDNEEVQTWGTYTQYGNTGASFGIINDRYYLGNVDVPVSPLSPVIVPGAQQTDDVNVALTFGNSGGSEPTWPTTIGGTVVDGELTWTAIYARQMTGTCTGGSDNRMLVESDLTTIPDNFFQYGTFTWLTGNNNYIVTEVRSSIFGGFYLRDLMPEVITAGDTFMATQGCNKLRGKCKGDLTSGEYGFDNVHNYGGFPDMPTETQALQSPVIPRGQPQQPTSSGGKG